MLKPRHLAHAWSAFIPSGFDRSLILSIDGEGDGLSGMVLVGNNGKFEVAVLQRLMGLKKIA